MKWRALYDRRIHYRGRGFLVPCFYFVSINQMTNKIAKKLNDRQKVKLQKIANKIERLEKEIQTNKIDADSGAFLIIQARREV